MIQVHTERCSELLQKVLKLSPPIVSHWMAVILLITMCCFASLASAGSFTELHHAWRTGDVVNVVKLRDTLNEDSDLNEQFQADFMVATAQCSTTDQRHQKAGLGLLEGLLTAYSDLQLAEIGNVYLAIRQCSDIINNVVSYSDKLSRDEQWIDPTSVSALIKDQTAKSPRGLIEPLELDGLTGNNIAYDPSKDCPPPCGVNGDVDVGATTIFLVLVEIGRYGPESAILDNLVAQLPGNDPITLGTLKAIDPKAIVLPIGEYVGPVTLNEGEVSITEPVFDAAMPDIAESDPMTPAVSAQITTPATIAESVEIANPPIVAKPADLLKPAVILKPAEILKPAVVVKPVEILKPTVIVKPVEILKPAVIVRPAVILQP